jgi:hypothetical protein
MSVFTDLGACGQCVCGIATVLIAVCTYVSLLGNLLRSAHNPIANRRSLRNSLGAGWSNAMSTYSIALRVRRVTYEDIYIAVPVTDVIMRKSYPCS